MVASSRLLALLVLASVVSGCGSKPAGPELAEVTGIVTLDGKPLVGKEVAFVPTNGRPAAGLTDDTGRYQLSVLGGKSGTSVGENSVSIMTPLAGPPAPNYIDPIPAKYNSRTTLTADVKPGKNEFDFALKSK